MLCVFVFLMCFHYWDALLFILFWQYFVCYLTSIYFCSSFFLLENSFSKIMKVSQILDSCLLLWGLLLPASIPRHSSFHSFLFCCFQRCGNLLSEVSWLHFLPYFFLSSFSPSFLLFSFIWTLKFLHLYYPCLD